MDGSLFDNFNFGLKCGARSKNWVTQLSHTKLDFSCVFFLHKSEKNVFYIRYCRKNRMCGKKHTSVSS